MLQQNVLASRVAEVSKTFDHCRVVRLLCFGARCVPKNSNTRQLFYLRASNAWECCADQSNEVTPPHWPPRTATLTVASLREGCTPLTASTGNMVLPATS